MMRVRLEGRIGPVVLVGVGRALGYGHAFTKLGRDGTGKGNIHPIANSEVHGAVYRLSQRQMAELERFEGGYEPFPLRVKVLEQNPPDFASSPDRSIIDAASFRAIKPVPPLPPTPQYITFYERGMREHDIPEAYREFILNQVRALWRAVDG